MDITVLGLGYIGLPTAIIFAQQGHKVKGFDVSKNVVEKLNEGHIHFVEEGLEPDYQKVFSNGSFHAYNTLEESDCYIISVPTPFSYVDGKRIADLKYVDSAAEMVAKILKKGDLVILESTVPPTTTRRMTKILSEKSGLSEEDFYTAHCPERVLPGRIMYEMQHNNRIIGAATEKAREMTKALYETILTEGKAYVTDDVTAELCKLVENSYRDVNIAFANELSFICDELQIDVKELITLANKHPRVNILQPGVGVGGHCIAVDPWFIVERFPDTAKLIHQARLINDHKPFFLSEKIESLLGHDTSKTVVILGMSYKPDIDDFRESPSLVLAEELAKKGYNVKACDPNCKADKLGNIPVISFDEALQLDALLFVAQKDKEFIERKEELDRAMVLYA